jgi:hypothetical protein
LDLPLRRRAQLAQLEAQKIKIRIPPNGDIKVGSLIEIFNLNDHEQFTQNKFKKISGKWMIAEIDHAITPQSHIMELILIRNGLHYDPNESKTPEAVFVEKTIKQ